LQNKPKIPFQNLTFNMIYANMLGGMGGLYPTSP